MTAVPIVIDLGMARDADIKELLSGAGTLREEIEEVMRLVRERTAQETSTKLLIPVIAVYTQAEHPNTGGDTVVNFRMLRQRLRPRGKASHQ